MMELVMLFVNVSVQPLIFVEQSMPPIKERIVDGNCKKEMC